MQLYLLSIAVLIKCIQMTDAVIYATSDGFCLSADEAESSQVHSLTHCAILCQQTPNCQSWSHNKNKGECRIAKSRRVVKKEAIENCRSSDNKKRPKNVIAIWKLNEKDKGLNLVGKDSSMDAKFEGFATLNENSVRITNHKGGFTANENVTSKINASLSIFGWIRRLGSTRMPVIDFASGKLKLQLLEDKTQMFFKLEHSSGEFTRLRTKLGFLPDQSWTHFAVNVNATFGQIFINGSQLTSEDLDSNQVGLGSGFIELGDTILIGSAQSTWTPSSGDYKTYMYFDGEMKCVGVGDEVLEEFEVKEVMDFCA